MKGSSSEGRKRRRKNKLGCRPQGGRGAGAQAKPQANRQQTPTANRGEEWPAQVLHNVQSQRREQRRHLCYQIIAKKRLRFAPGPHAPYNQRHRRGQGGQARGRQPNKQHHKTKKPNSNKRTARPPCTCLPSNRTGGPCEVEVRIGRSDRAGMPGTAQGEDPTTPTATTHHQATHRTHRRSHKAVPRHASHRNTHTQQIKDHRWPRKAHCAQTARDEVPLLSDKKSNRQQY